MDRKKWMVNIAKTSGRRDLPIYVIGIISEIARTACSADSSRVAEINRALNDLDQVQNDKSLPWDLEEAKKPSAPTESPKEIYHPKHTIDLSKVESLLDRWTAEQILGNEG